MKRMSLTVGTLEQLLAELDQYGADRAAHGKTDKARAIARAMTELESAGRAVVEHGLYVVEGSTLTIDATLLANLIA